jgi:hypothetical protein
MREKFSPMTDNPLESVSGLLYRNEHMFDWWI